MKRYLVAIVALLFCGAGCAHPFTATTQPSSAPRPVATSTAPVAGLHEERVDTPTVQGVFIVPEKTTHALPGILVIHEWWGLNDEIKHQSELLAAQGYAVFAIDLYNGEVATDATRAGQLVGSVLKDQATAVAEMNAALDFLASRPEVQANDLASLGWCFGGGQSALIGTSGDPRLKATVIYYGTPLPNAEQLKNMKQPVLGIFGKADQAIPLATSHAFEQTLKDQNTPAEFHYYEGAGHAFANPTLGASYRPEAAADAWAKTLDFLRRTLTPSAD